ncbi:unnamed protein product [Mytilus edulis]|uniref:Uncharacterized protein n=1 Tax=Mytilus edulis TaxID=6550 RepID=A0A8S3UW86_MYTED|nr:unnamed protein product [Mytilus edulis]
MPNAGTRSKGNHFNPNPTVIVRLLRRHVDTETKKKTKAEYQKEYRERKRLQNVEEYLQKENERKRNSYVKSTELSKRDLERKRRINRENVKLYRQRKKQEKQLVKQNDVSNKRTSSRKRISRAISRANRKIHKLEKELKTSNRKVWKLKKRISRLKIVKNESKSNKNQQNKENITPLTSADDEMRYVGLEPSKYKTIRRKLQFHNVLVEEIKAVDPCFTKNIVNGKVTKKFKMKSITSQVFRYP